MKLLVTGASGFVGRNIIPLLREMYEVSTMGLSECNDIQIDLAKKIPHLSKSYDIIFHAAGKAHSVPNNDGEKKLFLDVNLQGTINLCRALEKTKLPEVFILVSTVAVYGLEFGENITEEHPLNGNTAYALSKIQAEQYLTEWCTKNKVKLGIIRPSLIAGKNAPGNLAAMVDGIKTGKYFSIGGGTARKSILMVQDIATLLPLLVEKGGVYNVCDSEHPSFRELEEIICKQLDKNMPKSIPFVIAKIIALLGDLLGAKAPINSLKLKKISKSLTFSNEKAKKELKWEPLNVLDNYHL
ncbi:NAD-dependent epimerase/dehydratase family protein [Chryseobacterium sp.]|uniref:NAD-dependent epimerase/dehydratase family protein n=1 Tax=Chryseobacterium sp. TaxID=1871047 RepID=UPI00289C3B24|nr:NAD-dependent epimerase/dehydratase family protein [Chryseobacterium sp.]